MGYLTIKQTQQLGFKSRIMGSDPNSGLSFQIKKFQLHIKLNIINLIKLTI